MQGDVDFGIWQVSSEGCVLKQNPLARPDGVADKAILAVRLCEPDAADQPYRLVSQALVHFVIRLALFFQVQCKPWASVETTEIWCVAGQLGPVENTPLLHA